MLEAGRLGSLGSRQGTSERFCGKVIEPKGAGGGTSFVNLTFPGQQVELVVLVLGERKEVLAQLDEEPRRRVRAVVKESPDLTGQIVAVDVGPDKPRDRRATIDVAANGHAAVVVAVLVDRGRSGQLSYRPVRCSWIG